MSTKSWEALDGSKAINTITVFIIKELRKDGYRSPQNNTLRSSNAVASKPIGQQRGKPRFSDSLPITALVGHPERQGRVSTTETHPC